MAFNPLARCRHVESVGARKYEATASCGMIQGKLLRNCAALGIAKRCSGVNVQMIKQIREVRCELRDCVRRRKPPAPSVAAWVGNNHAMFSHEVLNDWRERLSSDHKP